MVTHMDRGVGRLTALLDDLGLRRNTVIFFAGDNGYSQWGYFGRRAWEDDPLFHNKGPWPKGKFTCTHEGGMRVPFFANWPGRIAGGESEHVCALYDVLATVADLAGVEAPPTDGISLTPTLLGEPEKQQSHDYLYWENGTRSAHAQSALLLHWWACRAHPSKPIQLYDLENDVNCRHDLAATQPAVVDQVKRIFATAHSDSEWYVNPGETKQAVDAKRRRAAAEHSLQVPVRANSVYPKTETPKSPPRKTP